MPEREEHADAEDRHPGAEGREQRVTEPAEGQLLDDRADDGEGDEVEDERRGVRRLPVTRH